MRLSFVWPSTHHRTGGVVAVYQFANAMARRGHDIHFIHGPAWQDRISGMAELGWFPFESDIQHHIVDSLDDPALPTADVVFWPNAPERLGHKATFVQGYQMLPEAIEVATFHTAGPKVCIASWLVDVGIELGVPREQLWHVPLGLDHDLFQARTPGSDRPYDIAVLYNEHPTKAWNIAAAALREVRARLPQARIVAFASTAPSRRLDVHVDLRVGLYHDRLAVEVYDAARVFVQASTFEGFGFTAVEAMSCGAALVTTDNGGSRDYARHDETAVVVPPGDSQGLAEGIVDLLTDPARRERLARAGGEWVRRFTWADAAEALETHLHRYLDDPPALQRSVLPSAVTTS